MIYGMAGQGARLMTEGAEWKSLLSFAFPLMVGNLFQQLYNTVDSIIVGNFVGTQALAAVGSVDSVINTFIGFFLGLSAGAGVVISQYFGAKDDDSVEKAVSSTIVITLVLSVITTVLAFLLTPSFLRLLGTPEDVWDEAEAYLRIYFQGVTGLLFYNMGSGILRAVGDSRRPLYFLIFSAILNTVLDIFFVATLRMGVEGAAYATIISQGISAILTLAVLTVDKGSYRIRWHRLRLDIEKAGQIVTIGLPTAIHLTVTSFSNIFIQSYIYAFGSAAMAGWSCYIKIDKVCILPLQSIGLSCTTFTGQNLGAGLVDRTRKGIRVAARMNFIISAVMATVLFVLSPHLVRMFTQDEDVVMYGTIFLRLLSPFFLCVGFNDICNGALKGAGNTRMPTIITMSTFIVFRQIYLFIVSRISDSFYPVALGYPLGWLLCTILLAIYYKRVDITKYKVT